MKNAKQNLKIKNIFRFSLIAFSYQSGQALISLLFFMIIAITITTTTVIVSLVNALSTSYLDQANNSYYVAEAGAENALIKLLRDPLYPGETMNVDLGTAVISVSGTSPIIITSTGRIFNSLRKIQVEAVFTNEVLVVNSWKEVL